MQEYVIIYLEILILCFLIAAIVHSKVSHDLGSEGEVIAFRWILRIFMTMMVLDSYTQLHYQQVIHPPQITVAFAYALYMSLLAILAVAWFYFAELQIDAVLTRKKWFRVLSVVPGLTVVVLCFVSIRTGWFFGFDTNGLFRRGPLFFLQNVFAYAYFLFTTIHAHSVALRESSPVRRRRLFTLSTFIIMPFVGALLQLVIGGYPMVGPGVCISILAIFVSIQADMINMDSLTGLNNRKSMERYLDEIIPRSGADTPFYVYMMDANRFKKINDTYGHVEGDRALRYIADSLRMTADRYQGFIARLGGDEFLAIVEGSRITDPEAFASDINRNLQTVCEQHRLPYELSVSVGYVACTSPYTRTGDLLRAADGMMYRVKHGNA